MEAVSPLSHHSDLIRDLVRSMSARRRALWSIACVERMLPSWRDLEGAPSIPALCIDAVVDLAWKNTLPSHTVDGRAAAETLYTETDAIECHVETPQAQRLRRAEWLALALVSLEDSMAHDDVEAAQWLSMLSVEYVVEAVRYADSGDAAFAVVEQASVWSLALLFEHVNVADPSELGQWRQYVRLEGQALLGRVQLIDGVRERAGRVP
jgi:hypothetical protein